MYSLTIEKQAQHSRDKDLKSKDDSRIKEENTLFEWEDCEDAGAISFSVGNPRVEHITGLVHLYRPTTRHSEVDTSTSGGQKEDTQIQKKLAAPSYLVVDPQEEYGDKVCCLAIPSDMSVANFCSFCGAYLEQIQQMQVFRREPPTRQVCMVLMGFSDKEHAKEFFSEYAGKPFSSLEPEITCKLVYVREVEFSTHSGGPLLPAKAHTELPTCPVCLERLDESISGVVTTVCNHNFHGECLKKWGDTSCPVCRYCSASSLSTSRCTICDSPSDLWICLICGHVGCGRYRAGHAIDHWKTTQHCYALELETQRVWDYVGDGYVHRLIQSKTDGKLIEVPSPASVAGSSRNAGACDGGDGPTPDHEYEECLKETMLASKLDAVVVEYTHLLTSQLDSQRQYYEGLVAHAKSLGDEKLQAAAATSKTNMDVAAEARLQATKAQQRRQDLQRQLNESKMREKQLGEERDFLKSLNDTLMHNQKDYKKRLEEAKNELAVKMNHVKELEEQVRDLMIYIEASRTIESNGGELKDSTILPIPQDQAKKKGKLKMKKKS